MKHKPLSRKMGKKARQIKREMDELRPQLIERSGGVCEWCGNNPTWVYIPDREELEMHHIDHQRNHTNRENCIMLCPYCHDTKGHGIGGPEMDREILYQIVRERNNK